MGFMSVFKKVGPVLSVLLLSNAVWAQEDFDPEYDNETAAGRLENAEQGAVTADEKAPPPASAATPAASEPSPAASSSLAVGAGAAVSASDDDVSLSSQGNSDYDAMDDEHPPAATEAAADELPPWKFGGSRHFSTLTGSTGLFHTIEAGSDAPGTFGIGIHGAFFKDKNYLNLNEEHTYMWGGLNLRITPIKYLEIFTGLEARANQSNQSDPPLFQSLGDFNIGLKGIFSPIDMLGLGLIFGMEFKNPVGDVSVSFDGLTFPLGLLATVDFAKIKKILAGRFHFNAIYRFDNSAHLIRDVENSRGGCDVDTNGDGIVDYSGCLDPIERKGLEIDRTDQFRFAMGIDAAFPYVTGLFEYVIDIPVNRQKFTCPLGANPSNPYDSCMDYEGFAGMRQFLSVGVRVLPPIKTLTVDFGVDVGLAGYARSVQELAPTDPYRIVFGLTYNFDPFAAKKVPVETKPCAPVVAPEPILPQPIISGYVHDAADPNLAVSGAAVKYMGSEMNPQLADSQGRFTSYPMPVGKLTVAVRADGYEDATFEVDIPDPRDAELTTAGMPADEGEAMPIVVKLDCPLVKKVETGRLTIKVEGKDGALAAADVQISDGTDTAGGSTNVAGELTMEAPAGRYTVTVSKTGFFDKERPVEVTVGGDSSLDIVLTEVPAESSVELGKERITIKKRVMFKSGSNELEDDSEKLLDEVVDLLKKHREITKLQIQGHTDNRGKSLTNLNLSAARAEAVMNYLIGEGIHADRLTSKGFGDTRPRAPNITPSGRAKNRRVEFHILERAE